MRVAAPGVFQVEVADEENALFLSAPRCVTGLLHGQVRVSLTRSDRPGVVMMFSCSTAGVPATTVRTLVALPNYRIGH